MRHQLTGLNKTAADLQPFADGTYLVRIMGVRYRRKRSRQTCTFVFAIVAPLDGAGNRFSATLDCAPQALWKLNWLLRDFGYSSELLERGEIDESACCGLFGVLSLSHQLRRGQRVIELEGFAPAATWESGENGTTSVQPNPAERG